MSLGLWIDLALLIVLLTATLAAPAPPQADSQAGGQGQVLAQELDLSLDLDDDDASHRFADFDDTLRLLLEQASLSVDWASGDCIVLSSNALMWVSSRRASQREL